MFRVTCQLRALLFDRKAGLVLKDNIRRLLTAYSYSERVLAGRPINTVFSTRLIKKRNHDARARKRSKTKARE